MKTKITTADARRLPRRERREMAQAMAAGQDIDPDLGRQISRAENFQDAWNPLKHGYAPTIGNTFRPRLRRARL